MCVCIGMYCMEKKDTIFGIYVILCLCLSCRSDDTIIAKNYKVCDGGTGQFVELITRMTFETCTNQTVHQTATWPYKRFFSYFDRKISVFEAQFKFKKCQLKQKQKKNKNQLLSFFGGDEASSHKNSKHFILFYLKTDAKKITETLLHVTQQLHIGLASETKGDTLLL